MKKFRCVIFGMDLGDPQDPSKPYPQMPELLLELRRLKIKTAVLSGKGDEIIHLEAERLFPFFKFDDVCGTRPGFSPKSDPASLWEILTGLDVNPRDTILVEDTGAGIKTALEAECHAVGAVRDGRDIETLKAAGAQRIISQPMELLELL